MEQIKYSAIGIIRTPFTESRGTPIQSSAGRGVEGSVEIFTEYADGLRDLDGFSHIILLYHFHRAHPPRLRATPFLDNVERGIFAIRGPTRPNPIGISIVRLTKIEGSILNIQDIDIMDGTPLLDIKPYIPKIDSHPGAKIGWLQGKVQRFSDTEDDGRFSDGIPQ
jgi:tRNA (adenine37-N6)-methyltransferase